MNKSVRLSDAEYEAVKEHAKAAGMSPHAWMRSMLLLAARDHLEAESPVPAKKKIRRRSA